MGFFFPPIIFEELRVGDGIDVDVSGGLMGGLLIEGVVSRSVGSMREIEVFGLVYEFMNG